MIKSKKKEEKLFVHVLDYYNSMFQYSWQIVFTNDMKAEITEVMKSQGATEKEIKRHVPSSESVCAQVMNIKLKNGKHWDVVIFDINKYTNNVGVHEAFHIVKEILFPRGMVIDKSASSEEPYAYLLGHVFDNINLGYITAMRDYREFKKKNKDVTV